MTISSETRKAGPYVGNDTATVFSFAFKVFAAADVYVVKTDTATGAESVLTLTADYTVSLNADQNASPGGTVTLPAVLATGYKLTITSALGYLQATDLTNQGGFYPVVITNALDKLTILIQQLRERANRALVIPVSDSSAPADLPALSDLAGNFLAFDANGNPIASSGTGADAGLRADLAASSGASLMGWIYAAASAVGATVQNWISWQQVNVFGFMTVTQIADVQSRAMVQDVSAAVQAAITASQGKTLRCPAGTYSATGLTGIDGIKMVGDGKSATVIRRPNATASTSPILQFSGNSGFHIEGIAFDGNKAGQTSAFHDVIITDCKDYVLEGCAFLNAKASGGYGAGIAVLNDANVASNTRSSILRNDFVGNDGDGFYCSKGNALTVSDNLFATNGASGLTVINYVFPPEVAVHNYFDVSGNRCYSNGSNGINFVGYYTGGTPSAPIQGPLAPPAIGVSITNNKCISNGQTGIAFQGRAGAIIGNYCASNGTGTDGTGILASAESSVVSGNTCHDNTFFGIDCGGTMDSIVSKNVVTYTGYTSALAGISINCGATINCTVSDNAIRTSSTGTAIYASGYEYGGGYFDQIGSGLTINGNTITCGSNSVSGILVTHGFDNVTCTGNVVKGTTIANSFVLAGGASNAAWLRESNNWGLPAGSAVTIASANAMVMPDIGDNYVVTGTTAINAFYTQTQSNFRGAVRFVQITNGGSGYSPSSPPTVSFSGGGGAGAAGTALVSNSGKIIGVDITSAGSGYTSAPSVSFSSGTATATAQIGAFNAEGRIVTLNFAAGATVNKAGNIFLSSPSFAAGAGGGSTLQLMGLYGNWYEVSRSIN